MEVSADYSRYGSPYYGLVNGTFHGVGGELKGTANELLVKGSEAASRLRQYLKEGKRGTQEADCHACDTEVLALRVANLTADYHSSVGGNRRYWGRLTHRKDRVLYDLYEALEEYGKIVYGRGYLVARHIAMQRNPTCQFCGLAPSEEAHHTALDYPADHEITPGDLTMLCKPCHRDATAKRRKRR